MNKELMEKNKVAIENLKKFLASEGYTDVVTPRAFCLPNHDTGVTLNTYISDFPDYQFKSILVTPHSISLFGKNPPTALRDWVLLKTTQYSSKEELSELVRKYTIDDNALNLWH